MQLGSLLRDDDTAVQISSLTCDDDTAVQITSLTCDENGSALIQRNSKKVASLLAMSHNHSLTHKRKE